MSFSFNEIPNCRPGGDHDMYTFGPLCLVALERVMPEASYWFEIIVVLDAIESGLMAPAIVIYDDQELRNARVILLKQVKSNLYVALAHVGQGEKIGLSLSSSTIRSTFPRVQVTKQTRGKARWRRTLLLVSSIEFWRLLRNELKACVGLSLLVKIRRVKLFFHVMWARQFAPKGLGELSSRISGETNYNSWFRNSEPDMIELMNQSSAFALSRRSLAVQFIIFSAELSGADLERSLLSIAMQSCGDADVVIVVPPESETCWNSRILGRIGASIDARVVRSQLGETSFDVVRRCVEPSTSNFVTFVAAGTEIAPDLMHNVDQMTSIDPSLKVLYLDDDAYDTNGFFVDPYFKPDWSLDLYLGTGYIYWTVLFARTLVLDRLAGSELCGTDLVAELIFWAAEKLSSKQIHHFPKVLYHYPLGGREITQDRRAVRSVERFVELHYQDAKLHATGQPSAYGCRIVKYKVPKIAPSVVVVVPTRDMESILRVCIDSILALTDYRNYRIIVIDNESVEKSTLEYLTGLAGISRVEVVRFLGDFNFAKMHNRLLEDIESDFVCFLNNDTQIVEPDWLSKMVALGSRKDVGIVGVKLLYPDSTLQHCGVVMGIGEALTAHSFVGDSVVSGGYKNRALAQQDVTAVTGACLLIRRELYRKVGGMDEIHLPVSYNDIDLCLKVREIGLKVIFDGSTTVVHHEGKTRGIDGTDVAKTARNNRERAYMVAHWGEKMFSDPFYNPNLSTNVPYYLGRLKLW